MRERHSRPAPWRGLAACALAFCSAMQQARADPFETERAVPRVAAGSLIGSEADCRFGPVGEPLQLKEAIERALCNNNQTRQAWIGIKVQAAAVGESRGAFLPKVSAEIDATHDEALGRVQGHPELSSSDTSGFESGNVSLSWVLFDFGGRDAALRNATSLLAAAQAGHDGVLQTVFATTAQDYYAAQAATGVLAAAVDAEKASRGSYEAASARVDKGVAPVTDALQAQTALAQATYNRAKAAGDLQVALGVLAADMNLRADTTLALPDPYDGVQPNAEFDRSVSELMNDAARTHPEVRQAQAQLDAAVAKVDSVRAQGLPSVSLVVGSSRNNRPVSPSLGQPLYPATGRDMSFGIQVSVPLFSGFSTLYQVKQAQAQVELQQVALDDSRRQVELGVWTAYQHLQTATQNLDNSIKLLEAAHASREATQARYVSGVGSIIEQLAAESALVAAVSQRLQALTDWRSSRLQLAGKLGALGMWRIAAADARRDR